MLIYNLQFTIYNEFLMLDKVITYSFYLLFFITPLFWTSLNYELFEFNKMLLVYAFTVVIVAVWLLKSINDKRFTIKRTPLDIPLLLFLGANILSTIFSIDTHTSFWGYYSRSNGGLLSLISYLLLYFAFVSNIDKEQVKTCLKFGLASGLIISLYAILEHFGVSPSCVILRGSFGVDCWIQDVQARVFATLGQPNWLAAYLSMLIFPAFYFLLSSKTQLQTITYYLLTITYYLAFTFTYSRGPTLGLIGGMLVFIPLIFGKPGRRSIIFIIIISFILINLLFGSALTSFRLISKFSPPPRPQVSISTTNITQLENGGTESGQIRFIVWQGALDIFRSYPIFGSGLETFAYSYYQFRPHQHNLTSEWDFLYNKAHNEYLNYLATTGLVGLGSYSIIIITFIIVILRKRRPENLLLISLLASYISYLIYNFFLFSVVIIAVFFYLFPALAFVYTDKQLYPLRFTPLDFARDRLYAFIYRQRIYTNITKGVITLATIYLLFSIYKLWLADTLFNQGQHAQELGNPGKAYNLLAAASSLNAGEPFYRSELAYNAASAAVALSEKEATLSAKLQEEAVRQTENVLRSSPKNISFYRTAVRTYFELSAIDPQYIQKTLETLDQTISLAPTDPKLYYNKALIFDSIDRKEEAIKALQKALQLKPNYIEVKTQLEEATKSAE